MQLLTGPNMSGKSTFLRTISVAIVLAQIGCPVPAECYKGPISKNILCRIGGYDFGSSTFQTEMGDVQQILKECDKQLDSGKYWTVIDEIGRGTEQISSDALGQAIIKYLVDHRVLGMISTHSNQLNICAQTLGLGTFEMRANILPNKKVQFLYELRKLDGENQMSLGCEVAELAGVDTNIVQRAKELRDVMKRQI